MKNRAIHQKEALRLLEDGNPHRLRVWKMSTGEILLYSSAICIGAYRRGGTHKVRLLPSGEIRRFRDICLFNIDDMQIYL